LVAYSGYSLPVILHASDVYNYFGLAHAGMPGAIYINAPVVTFRPIRT
jgi:hypothetical protein